MIYSKGKKLNNDLVLKFLKANNLDTKNFEKTIKNQNSYQNGLTYTNSLPAAGGYSLSPTWVSINGFKDNLEWGIIKAGIVAGSAYAAGIAYTSMSWQLWPIPFAAACFTQAGTYTAEAIVLSALKVIFQKQYQFVDYAH